MNFQKLSLFLMVAAAELIFRNGKRKKDKL